MAIKRTGPRAGENPYSVSKEITEACLPQIVKAWKTAVEKLDKEEILACYDKDGFLKGAIWGKYVGTHENIAGYFDQFLDGVKEAKVQFERITKTGPDLYQGEYTFKVKKEGDGKFTELKAVFKFMVSPDGEYIDVHFSNPRKDLAPTA